MNESSTSSKKTVAWEKCRMNTHADAQHAHDVGLPAVSALLQLTAMEYPPGVNIGYIPSITATTTSMNVILAILNKTVGCIKKLALKFIFLGADQAIYNKVGNTICLIITMYLMKTIYSRFQEYGLVELLSEAGVGSEGTIKAGLSGFNFKQGIRYYNLLFEALLRSKITYLDDLQIDRVDTETHETSADASDCQMTHDAADSLMSHCSDDASDHTRMPHSSDDASGHPPEDAVQDTTSSTGDPSNSNSTHSEQLLTDSFANWTDRR